MAPKVWKMKTTTIVTNHHHQNNSFSEHPKHETKSTTTMATETKVWKMKNTLVVTTDQSNKKEADSDHTEEEEKDEKDDVGLSLDRVNICLEKKKMKKKLLVIPLRGIFVHRAHRSWPETIPRNRRPDFRYGNFLVYMRPYCVEFLKFCFEKFEVGLWSSTRELDQEHCTKSGFMCLEIKDKPLFLKELSHLWEKKYPNLPWSDGEYSASNTLMFTHPEKAILNPPNTSISPPSYEPEKGKDDLLGPNGELRVFLAGLAEAEDVQTYVEEHPFGDPEITPSHPAWDHYCKIICSINKKRFGDISPKLI
ncbi:hypothetical protein M8C21_012599 [Ambrosia artemisiifolia]|uniref:Mitochondrial import inner membrane translocase subunit TIM50 n=1 Tax=Ambrosia artemisiifolia TaxID=4212 RepID=A0AAD5GVU9_AMBAR|nr:hypothetical protein M8C21_012599 [Ambrosia artemisiifolia]